MLQARCRFVCRRLLTAGLILWSGAALAVAQDEPASEVKPLPWLHLGAEIRARSEYEHCSDSETAIQETELYTRSRLHTQVDATRWLRFHFQLQDSRVILGRPDGESDDHENLVDVQYAYVELGSESGSPWTLRLGRQAIELGDARLIGADGFWDNRARSFNGVRAILNQGSWSWDLFSANPTNPFPRRLDVRDGSLLSGIAASWHRQDANLTIQPYLLWRRTPAGENVLPAELFAPGIRLGAVLLGGWSANVEMLAQRGRVQGVPTSAWAGYWEVSRPLTSSTTAPRLALGYGHASGDQDPSDQRFGTFDDLYPAGYNGCGFLEPFAWRNVRDLHIGADWTGPAKWRFAGEAHRYWRATIRDGVYVDEGPALALDTSSSSANLGYRLNATARRDFGRHSALALGYAWFSAPSYLLNADIEHGNSFFVSFTVRL